MIMKNQLLNLKMIALMCLMMVLGGANVWADNVTFGPDWKALFATDYGNSFNIKANELELNGVSNGVSIKVTNGTSTNGYIKPGDFRAYKDYTITIKAPSNSTITAIKSEAKSAVGKQKPSISADNGTVQVSATSEGSGKNIKYKSTISWTGSSNTVVFSVKSGSISFGKITVTYEQGATLKSLAISGTPTKTTYNVGEEFDPTGLVVTGTYEDNTTATITNGITWTMNPATLSLSDVSCSVTATVDGVTSPAYNVTGLTVNKAKLPATITLTGNATTLATDDEPNTFTVGYDGDGTLSATASAEGVVDIALVGKTVTVTPKAVGSVDITVAATEGAEYKATSTTYTVNVVPVGIRALRNSITSISSKDPFTAVKLKNAVVTYVGKPTYSGGAKTIYVEDANAGIVFYGSDFTYEEGDVLNGTISGNGVVYQGLTEVTSIDASSNIVVTKNGVIPCHEVTVDELNKNMDKWESRRVKLLDVTVSSAMNRRNAEISQDGNTIAVYEKIKDCSGDLLSKVNTKIASIVCYPQDHTASSKTTNQLCIWEESDIVVEPTYTPAKVNFVAHAGADYYATFSNANVVFMPKDVTISTVAVEKNSIVLCNSTEGYLGKEETVEIAGNNVAGYYIPANTGVLLNSKNSGEVTYYTVENKEVAAYDAILNNMLMPSVAGGEFTAEPGKVYYKLAYNDYYNHTGLGFYWGAENGGAFKVKAGTAYLAVPKTIAASAKGFTLNGEATGIDGVNANVENAKAIYNLNGQRVASMAKPGLYIVNGKKVVRK